MVRYNEIMESKDVGIVLSTPHTTAEEPEAWRE